MNVANISYTKNHLSELLDRVRQGETILIVDRDQPVAYLAPPPAGPPAARRKEWTRRGLIQPARTVLKPASLDALPFPAPAPGGDILAALLADREEQP